MIKVISILILAGGCVVLLFINAHIRNENKQLLNDQIDLLREVRGLREENGRYFQMVSELNSTIKKDEEANLEISEIKEERTKLEAKLHKQELELLKLKTDLMASQEYLKILQKKVKELNLKLESTSPDS